MTIGHFVKRVAFLLSLSRQVLSLQALSTSPGRREESSVKECYTNERTSWREGNEPETSLLICQGTIHTTKGGEGNVWPSPSPSHPLSELRSLMPPCR